MRRSGAARAFKREEIVATIQGATNRGQVRPTNQDFYALDKKARIAIIADGMGGQAAGEVASRMATKIVLGELRSMRPEIVRQWTGGNIQAVAGALENSVRLANQRIFERGKREPDKRGMGTTLDVVLLLDRDLFIAHVGDSRVYRVSENTVERLTRDHSMAASLMESGTVSSEEALLYENVLLRSVGTEPELDVDVIRYDVRNGDVVVLCTDGVWHYFRDPDELANLVHEASSDPAARLVNTSVERGGEDNATAVTISIHT